LKQAAEKRELARMTGEPTGVAVAPGLSTTIKKTLLKKADEALARTLVTGRANTVDALAGKTDA